MAAARLVLDGAGIAILNGDDSATDRALFVTPFVTPIVTPVVVSVIRTDKGDKAKHQGYGKQGS